MFMLKTFHIMNSWGFVKDVVFLICLYHPMYVLTLATVVNTTVRSAFEYQGQKCSACSRMYVPDSLWPQVWYPVIQLCVFDVATVLLDTGRFG